MSNELTEEQRAFVEKADDPEERQRRLEFVSAIQALVSDGTLERTSGGKYRRVG